MPTDPKNTVVRMANPERAALLQHLFRRYPAWEWATFARFGWRETEDALVLTLAALDLPGTGDLDEQVGHVAITEPYTLRMALGAETHPLAVGVIHSHPRECAPRASSIDDDMDEYYAEYFPSFAPGRPYASLIVAEIAGRVVMGGRVWWKGQWRPVTRFLVDGDREFRSATDARSRSPARGSFSRVARLTAAFGDDAGRALRAATVGVVGAGGTGSAAVETLARAGVGRLIIVDPDHLEDSNLERVHGSVPSDARSGLSKVAIAARHAREIRPECEVVPIRGALPQAEAVDALVSADVVLGCTDRQHSRLALSDLAIRYLVPSLDCGVTLEGKDGHVSAQILQWLRMLPSDPCVLCQSMIDAGRVSRELMSDEEREQRRQAAADATRRGEDPDPYWADEPQLNTVGYLTTTAGTLAAGYAVGWITGRFVPPFSRLQMDLLAPDFSVVSWAEEARADCVCRRSRGWADQGVADAMISAPAHWPRAERVDPASGPR